MVPMVLTMANRNKTPTAEEVEHALQGVRVFPYHDPPLLFKRNNSYLVYLGEDFVGSIFEWHQPIFGLGVFHWVFSHGNHNHGFSWTRRRALRAMLRSLREAPHS